MVEKVEMGRTWSSPARQPSLIASLQVPVSKWYAWLSMEWPVRLTTGSPHKHACILHVYMVCTHIHTYKHTQVRQLWTRHWIWKWFRIRKDMLRVFQTLAFTLFLLIVLLTTPRRDLTEMLLDSNQTSPLAWYHTVQVPPRVWLMLRFIMGKTSKFTCWSPTPTCTVRTQSCLETNALKGWLMWLLGEKLSSFMLRAFAQNHVFCSNPTYPSLPCGKTSHAQSTLTTYWLSFTLLRAATFPHGYACCYPGVLLWILILQLLPYWLSLWETTRMVS